VVTRHENTQIASLELEYFHVEINDGIINKLTLLVWALELDKLQLFPTGEKIITNGQYEYEEFEILIAMDMKISVFWDKMPM
jgi:hypothetical protein